MLWVTIHRWITFVRMSAIWSETGLHTHTHTIVYRGFDTQPHFYRETTQRHADVSNSSPLVWLLKCIHLSEPRQLPLIFTVTSTVEAIIMKQNHAASVPVWTTAEQSTNQSVGQKTPVLSQPYSQSESSQTDCQLIKPRCASASEPYQFNSRLVSPDLPALTQ